MALNGKSDVNFKYIYNLWLLITNIYIKPKKSIPIKYLILVKKLIENLLNLREKYFKDNFFRHNIISKF